MRDVTHGDLDELGDACDIDGFQGVGAKGGGGCAGGGGALWLATIGLFVVLRRRRAR